MACPYFLPAAPLAGLNDLYNGTCAADAGSPISSDLLRSCCNNGYAREVCNRAAQSDADAFRFLIKADQGGTVDVAWSSERNHHPVAVGNLSFPHQAVQMATTQTATAVNTPLERQARVHVDNYLRQIGSSN
jgi:hypothetical protein